MTTVLVTGGCGFIGSHLVDRLVADGHQVRVLDNLTDQVHQGRKPSHLNNGAEYRFEDIRNLEALRGALDGVEQVVHLAAAVGVGQSMYQPAEYVSANTMATAGLMQLLIDSTQKPRKLLVASSMSVYGEGAYQCEGCGPTTAERTRTALERGRFHAQCSACGARATPLPTPESKPVEPSSVYALTKYDQELLFMSLGRAYEMPTVALRFFNTYGPRQSLSNPYTGVGAIFSSRLRNNEPPIVYEDGKQMRDFVHVSDVVEACSLALSNSAADFGVFNVGSGAPISIGALARLLIEIHDKQGVLEPSFSGSFRTGDIRHCFADITALRRLGYEPSVSLETGLRELADWSASAPAEDRFGQAQAELRERGLV